MTRIPGWLRVAGVGLAVTVASATAFHQLNPLAPRPALTLFEPPRPAPQPWPDVFTTSGQLADWLAAGDALALDLRPRAQYENGHIPGARQLDLGLVSLAEDLGVLRQALGRLGISGRQRVVLYGDAADLPRLGQAFWLLELAGVARASVLREGFDGWYLAGGAIETLVPPAVPVAFDPPPRAEALASLDWMRGHVGLAGTEVLDVRDESSWSRPDYEAPPRFAAGHIPTSSPAGLALWVEDGWPSPPEIWQHLLDLGPRPNSYLDLQGDVVLVGQDAQDPWAGLGYLLLRSVGVKARVLAEGWAGWSRCPRCPRVRIVTAAEVVQALARPAEAVPVVADLRERNAFERGHIPGALSLPAYDLDSRFEAELARHHPGLARGRVPLVLYCYGRSCVRSREASGYAARRGFLDLWWLRDGLDGWPAETLPLVGSGEGP